MTRPGAPPDFDLDPDLELDLALIDAIDGPIGLAVSGGGDSVALAVLLCEARPDRHFLLLTVDHGLRPEAAEECRFVVELADRLGRPAVVLPVGQAPRGSLQSWAREARYERLSAAARAHGLAAIATGHTMDDQAETVLMRLGRGSGLRGLASMRPDTVHHEVRIVRPLLRVRREALRRELARRAIAWRDDPSNADTRFERIAVRHHLPQLAALGLTPERLAGTAAHLARASDLVDRLTDELMGTAARRDRTGAVVIEAERWAAAHEEVRLRALAAAVTLAGGLAQPPRFDTLAAAEAALRAGERVSLGRANGVLRRGAVQLWRERRGIETVTVEPGQRAVFDGRYCVTVPPGGRAVRVGPAGEAARPYLRRGDVRPAAATMPAVFAEAPAETMVALPTLGVRRRGWPADGVSVTLLRPGARFGPKA